MTQSSAARRAIFGEDLADLEAALAVVRELEGRFHQVAGGAVRLQLKAGHGIAVALIEDGLRVKSIDGGHSSVQEQEDYPFGFGGEGGGGGGFRQAEKAEAAADAAQHVWSQHGLVQRISSNPIPGTQKTAPEGDERGRPAC